MTPGLHEVGTGGIAAILAAELIDALKRSPRFAWITQDTESVNRLLGGGIAFLTGLGLNFSFDQNTGQLIIGGLVWASLTHGLAQWAGQLAYSRIAIRQTPIVGQDVPVVKLG